MVTITKTSTTSTTNQSLFSRLSRHLAVCLAVSVLFWLIVSFPEHFADETANEPIQQQAPQQLNQVAAQKKDSANTIMDPIVKQSTASDTTASDSTSAAHLYTCPYMHLSDLTDAERVPKASATRHIVDPPRDTRVGLVCCSTSEGAWNIAVHHAWAPIGAQRFIDMVQAHHFSTPQVPLMRCIEKFLCQFGLNGASSKKFGASLKDDPQWLPEGPARRVNPENGVKRFQRGYMSYAGGGNNSRSNQLFVALADNGMLGGGSPWEVPWGELVGKHSYETLDKIYTGYGEHGPGQGMLHHDNAIERTEQEFSLISWIHGCRVVDSADDGSSLE